MRNLKLIYHDELDSNEIEDIFTTLLNDTNH